MQERRPSASPARISLPHVAAAVEFIETHAQDAITCRDIAQAAFVSVRYLQRGFRQELSTSPVGYLRSVRLERVRAELQEGCDGRVLVSDCAAKWGFAHLSRFAEYYRNRFDELPSQTLRRSRRSGAYSTVA